MGAHVTKPEIHPAAEIFPMMCADEMRGLVGDIKENGLREPITLLDGRVLDGRNRLEACERAGVEPRFDSLAECADPVRWVLSHNLHRRHLTATQRALAAERAMPLLEEQAKARMSAGGRGDKISTPSRSRSEAASLTGVSPAYVQSAKRVRRDAPEVAALAEQGLVKMSAAVELSKLPEPERAEAVEKIKAGEKPRPPAPPKPKPARAGKRSIDMPTNPLDAAEAIRAKFGEQFAINLGHALRYDA